MSSVRTMLRKAHLPWTGRGTGRGTGHVVHMADERLPVQIFYGDFTHDKRSLSGRRKRFKAIAL
jgi:hypothetical protein